MIKSMHTYSVEFSQHGDVGMTGEFNMTAEDFAEQTRKWSEVYRRQVAKSGSGVTWEVVGQTPFFPRSWHHDLFTMMEWKRQAQAKAEAEAWLRIMHTVGGAGRLAS